MMTTSATRWWRQRLVDNRNPIAQSDSSMGHSNQARSNRHTSRPVPRSKGFQETAAEVAGRLDNLLVQHVLHSQRRLLEWLTGLCSAQDALAPLFVVSDIDFFDDVKEHPERWLASDIIRLALITATTLLIREDPNLSAAQAMYPWAPSHADLIAT
jgi:hypothetical protein